MLQILHRRPKVLLPSLLPKFSSTSSSFPLPPLSALRGTVQPHDALILLRSQYPPPIFPQRGPVSEVAKELQIKAARWGGVVNWMWDRPWDPSEHKGAEESYSATVFSRHGQLDVPLVDAGNVNEVGEAIRQFAHDGQEKQNQEREKREHDGVVHLLVCTHMNRDCRCGERGGALVQAFKEEVERARETNLIKIKVNIGQLGHIGGHQFAPNLLIYPYGDWYGLLSPAQVPQILAEIQAAAETRGVRALEKTEEVVLSDLREHWRGRMGLSKEEQTALAEKFGLQMPPD